MIIARSVSAAAQKGRLAETGCVVTIGNFDGLHLGHQAMLRTARDQADRYQLPLLVMSFDPHPETFFLKAQQSARLSSFGERIVGLKRARVDIACIVPFNQAMAEITHTQFVEHILKTQFNVKCLVIGDDFKYGKGRAGNAETLLEASTAIGFELVQLSSVTENAKRVSSSGIRQLLESGKLDDAARYLGRPYQMMGRVMHGDARGRTWGFPTLNLAVKYARALNGVYVVRVQGLENKRYEGVANLGKRPTVDGLKILLEVHLLDFQGDVYGERVCVEFCQQIRPEQKFDSFEALKTQIKLDVKQARKFFKNTKS